MVVKTASGKESEASLEARINAAITAVFPSFNSTELEHQTSFTVRVGKKDHIYDGSKEQLARGRADILIKKNGASIAVLELKRPSSKLTEEDVEQGLSYARLIHPIAPLVVVTNATETWLYETSTGSKLARTTIDEKALITSINSAAQIAEDDLRRAISTLLGTDELLWLELVKSATATKLIELSGTPSDTSAPFTEDFYIPREVVNDIQSELLKTDGARILFVRSDPGQGLSSVLRGLVSDAPTLSPKDKYLFLEAESSPNLEAAIGSFVEAEFDIPLDKGQVRHWLRRLSQTSTEPFVVVIDDLEIRHEALIEALKFYSDRTFGNGLKFVVGTNDHVFQSLTIRGKGKATMLGRRSKSFECQNLNDEEFSGFVKMMKGRGVHFMNGVRHSMEMRRPWVLRYMTSWTLEDDMFISKTAIPVIPSMVSTDLLISARQEHPDQSASEAMEDLAECFLEMVNEPSPSPEFSIETLHRFILPLKKVRDVLTGTALKHLIELGYVRHSTRSFGRVLSIRRPIVFASFIAEVLAGKLKNLLDDESLGPEGIGRTYTENCSKLPMGDIIGAFALSDVLRSHEKSPLPLVMSLLSRAPSTKPIPVGTKAIAFVEDDKTLKFKWLEDGEMEVELPHRQKAIITVGEDEVPTFIVDSEPWVMLAHFAMTPSELLFNDGESLRFDPGILLRVGQSEHPLRRPGSVSDSIETAHHKAKDGTSVLCHHNGFTEIGTLAIMRLLDGLSLEMCEQWVEEACEINSPALLMRVDFILSQLAHNISPEKAALAKDLRTNTVKPLIKGQL